LANFSIKTLFDEYVIKSNCQSNYQVLDLDVSNFTENDKEAMQIYFTMVKNGMINNPDASIDQPHE
jgi:hypothetical protein